MGKSLGRNAILKRCVLSLERNIGKEDEFRISGGSEFQSRGPMQWLNHMHNYFLMHHPAYATMGLMTFDYKSKKG